MLRALCIVGVAVLLAAGAAADTVYMRDGKTFEGKAHREGDKVVIEMPLGTIEVPAAEVIHIAEGPVASQPAAPAQPTTEPSVPSIAGRAVPFSIEKATRPEPVVFMLMRNLAATPPGLASAELRKQIESWQMIAHDRKRQVAGAWQGPKDFERRRNAYAELVKEADDLLRKARPLANDTPAAKAEKTRSEQSAVAKLRQAAQAWPDGLLRLFLTGIAEHKAKNYAQAEALFRQACNEAPRVAAFYQGLGMALQKLDRQTDALAAFTQALRLQPDSADALRLVRDAAQNVPGADTMRPAYATAMNLLSRYEDSSQPTNTYLGRGTNWLMPGKSWMAREDGLPNPPYDRLVFRQAAAVPVAASCLMVDESVVKDALEVFVRVNEGTVAPAQVRRGYTSFSTTKAKPVVSLSLVNVPDFTFSPASPAREGLSAGQSVQAYGLGVFEEIGSVIRPIPMRAESAAQDGTVKFSAGLAPGEAAAPVLAGDKLVGFLAGKTDATADNGGGDRFGPVLQAMDLIKQAQKPAPSYSYGFARAKRTIAPLPADGKCFVLYAVASERTD